MIYVAVFGPITVLLAAVGAGIAFLVNAEQGLRASGQRAGRPAPSPGRHAKPRSETAVAITADTALAALLNWVFSLIAAVTALRARHA